MPASPSCAFAAQEFRDLQILSQLAWFDEEFLENDPRGSGAHRQGPQLRPGRSGADAAKSRSRSWARVIPAYHQAARLGPDRDFDHALLSSDSAAAVRFQYRLGFASRRSAAARASAIRRTPPAAPAWRANISTTEFGKHAGRVCGPRKARSLMRLSRSGRARRASTGPPPTAASWTARSAAASGIEGLYRPYRWTQQRPRRST